MHPKLKKAISEIRMYAQTTGNSYMNCRQISKFIDKSHTWVWSRLRNGEIKSYIMNKTKKTKDYRSAKVTDLIEYLTDYESSHKFPLYKD